MKRGSSIEWSPAAFAIGTPLAVLGTGLLIGILRLPDLAGPGGCLLAMASGAMGYYGGCLLQDQDRTRR